MKPDGQIKFFGLDHLRALAITLVFFNHYALSVSAYPEWLHGFTKLGWTGVDLFFVLSGFLISSQLFSQIKQEKVISVKEFFLKRFFRILPAYWVAVAIYFCFPLFSEKENLPPLGTLLTFTQNFGLNTECYGTFTHAWSLCVEEHFYLLFPIILILLQFTNLFKNAYWLLVVIFLLSLIIKSYSWYHYFLPHINQSNAWIFWYKYFYFPTYNRLDGLLAGVSIAALYHFLPDVWSKVSKFGNLFIVMGMMLLAGTYFLCYREQSFHTAILGLTLLAVSYGLMVIGAISPTSFAFKLNSRFTTSIATLSYSIYLLHKGVIHVTQALLANTIDLHGNLMLLICCASCLLAAFTLHLIIEKSFMKLGRKIIARKINPRTSP